MKRNIFFAFVFFASTFALNAQNNLKYKLRVIVVSANRTNTPEKELANSITIITAKQIKALRKNSLIDILKDAPGLTVIESGNHGSLTSVFLRGAGSQHTLVLINGIKVNDPTSPVGGFDFSNISPDEIQRIEIIRGPQSTLYGSDAIAGVINIITNAKYAGREISLLAEGGSNSYYRTNVSARGSSDGFFYNVDFSRQASKGFSIIKNPHGNSERDGYSKNVFSFNAGYSFTKSLNANFYYRYSLKKADLDDTFGFIDDPNYTTNSENHLFNLNLNWNSFNDKWRQSFKASYSKGATHTVNPKDNLSSAFSKSFNYGKRFQFTWQNNFYFIKNNVVTVGLENLIEKSTTSYYSVTQWGPYKSLFPEKEAVTNSVYFQDMFKYKGKLFVTAGVRYDRHKRFGGVATYRIAPAYYISSTATKLKFTYGTGFKAPSLFDLYDANYGNPDLKPEKSTGWDFGIEQFLFHYTLSFSLTYYNTQLEDLIGFDSKFKAININKAASTGIEFEINWKPSKTLNGNLTYTYTKALNKSPNDPEKDLQLLRRPRNKITLALNYLPMSKLNVGLDYNYVGVRYDKNYNAFPIKRVELKNYSLLNAAVNYKLNKALTFYLRFVNLLNAKYHQVFGISTLGRSFYGGVNVKL